MNLLIWLVVGGVIGWLASLIMRTDAQQGVLLNVVVGIVGAMLGGWLISPLLGVASINQSNFSIGALIVSLVGAVILLAIVNLFRRGAVRSPFAAALGLPGQRPDLVVRFGRGPTMPRSLRRPVEAVGRRSAFMVRAADRLGGSRGPLKSSWRRAGP